ncbi:CPBP family intramembrane glutamic endopeptidase [Actibacterium lipolyticum]|uniref:CAAX amino terminal protease self- immunity n=1 Tax=Actibacterium lipolyticum TaxID=1524263 RepID=A0A238JKJ8_9RHOB|nr:CPBP family intramembrane glutamic endopeptidase [Actibacterium lipolyticum]SMX30707.1 CAAX amino terminal protease self- immunity [Actibacterium lipolyticum]
MRYAPHESFAAPARNRPEIWRLIVGFLAINLIQLMLIFGCYSIVANLAGQFTARQLFNDVFISTLTARDTLLMLGSFGFLIVGIAIVVTRIHHRPFLSLIGAPGQAVQDFFATLKALAILSVVIAFALPNDIELMPNLAFAKWALLLPISILVLFIQVSAEELLFRGYLQQQLAARFRSPVIWMLLPALIFGAGHYAPDAAGENAVFVTIWAALFGLIAADLTARSGNLGPAIALHFVNNAAAILFVSLSGPMSGLALYLYPYEADSTALQPLFAVDLGVLFVSWLAARVALRV